MRRQFHTLKGSGRMVGLTELGEHAYKVEADSQPPARGRARGDADGDRDDRRCRGRVPRLDRDAQGSGSRQGRPGEARCCDRRRRGGASVGRRTGRAAPLRSARSRPAGQPLELRRSRRCRAGACGGFAGRAARARRRAGRIARRGVAGQRRLRRRGSRDHRSRADAQCARGSGSRRTSLHRRPSAIGDVTLAPDLFAVLVDEAEGHLATLAHELSVLQFDSTQLPSAAMVRASHTLCGIHRTSGFPLIALTAGSLEQCLLALQRTVAPLPESSLPVLAQCDMGARRARHPREVARRVQRDGFGESRRNPGALDALRREATTEPVPIDAETQAAHEFVASEEAVDAIGRAAGGEAAAEKAQRRRPPWRLRRPNPRRMRLRPLQRPPRRRHRSRQSNRRPNRCTTRSPTSATTSTSRYCRSSSRKRPSSTRRPALRCADGDARPAMPAARGSCAARCTHSRAARGWPVRCASESSRIGWNRGFLLANRTSRRRPNCSRRSTPTSIGSATCSMRCAKARRTSRCRMQSKRSPERSHPRRIAEAAAGALAATAPGAERHVVVPLAAAQPAAPAAAEVETGAHAMLRVRADIIDRLVNEAGEVAITRARIEGELRALKANLLELTGSVVRLRTQVREFEIQAESQIQSRLMQVGEGDEGFDPLEFDRYTRFQELARSLAEGVNDVSTIQQSLLRNLDVTDAALISQARLSRDVAQQLFSIRTVPFGSLSERLYRILRGTAKELDKRANLEIGGAQTELDRSVLEKLVGPLEHLLRNALSHGIEPRSVRAKAGKSETGEITLTVRQVGNEIAIELTDDGAGLDLESDSRQGRRTGTVRGRRQAERRAADRLHLRAGLHDGVEGHPGLRPRHRDGRRPLADPGARRTRRSVDAQRKRDHVQAVPAAHARRRADRARPCRRPPVGAAGADGREGRADEARGARRALRAAARPVAGDDVSIPLPAAASRRSRADSGVDAHQRGAAAAQRPEPRSHSRRRNDRQPGSRREEHRAAARARVRNRRRDGARYRRDRADHQSGAARAARRRAGVRAQRRTDRAGSAEDGRRAARQAAGDDRRRFAHRAPDHEPAAHARGIRRGLGKGRHRRAGDPANRDARRDPPRHRDAAHGRLRVHEEDQGRRQARARSPS